MEEPRKPLVAFVAVALMAAALGMFLAGRHRPRGGTGGDLPPPGIVRQPGIAVVVLVDVSGSMQDKVDGADGRPATKISIARKTVLALLRRSEDFLKANPDRNLQVSVQEFSARTAQALCRPVVPMGKPDLKASEPAVRRMAPEGGTPIGEAMVVGNGELDLAALASSHLVVVTDGENTDGRDPGEVTRALSRLPLEHRPAVYFIAFDVSSKVFSPVQEAGGLVLSASNEKQLMETMDYILGEKILIEKPSGSKK